MSSIYTLDEDYLNQLVYLCGDNRVINWVSYRNNCCHVSPHTI